jgi:hypothetical protein
VDAASAKVLIIVFTSALGAGYFVYGRKESRAWFLLSGAALCVYPYLVSSLWATALLGVAIAAAPFFVED